MIFARILELGDDFIWPLRCGGRFGRRILAKLVLRYNGTQK